MYLSLNGFIKLPSLLKQQNLRLYSWKYEHVMLCFQQASSLELKQAPGYYNEFVLTVFHSFIFCITTTLVQNCCAFLEEEE